jgi:hypothetical protein
MIDWGTMTTPADLLNQVSRDDLLLFQALLGQLDGSEGRIEVRAAARDHRMIVPSAFEITGGVDLVHVTTANDQLAMQSAGRAALILTGAVVTPGAGWVWDAETGTGTATTATSDLLLTPAEALTVGQIYWIQYTVTRSAGSVQPFLGTGAGTVRSTNATFVELIACAGTGVLKFTGTGFTGTVSGLKIFELSPPLPLAWSAMPASWIVAVVRAGAIVVGGTCWVGWYGTKPTE